MRVQQRGVNGTTVPPEVIILSTSSFESSAGRKTIRFEVVNHEGVRKSLGFLWAHCDKILNVPVLSRVSGMSARGIHQAFMKHLGRPPGQVLRDMRIQRAKELLVKFDYKMKVVAAKAGYRSLNSFEVAFKNSTGLSPKQFQGQRRCCNEHGQQSGNTPTFRGTDSAFARPYIISNQAQRARV